MEESRSSEREESTCFVLRASSTISDSGWLFFYEEPCPPSSEGWRRQHRIEMAGEGTYHVYCFPLAMVATIRSFHSWLGWEVSHQDKAGVTYFLPSIYGRGEGHPNPVISQLTAPALFFRVGPS